MKEYLVKTDSGKFLWTKDASDILADRVIAIPDGADTATLYNGYLIFWKNDVWSFSKKDGDTEFVEGGDNMTLSEYLEWYEDTKIIWQRSETEYLMQGKNGEHLMESVGQLDSGNIVSAFVVDGEEKHSHYRKSVKHLDFIDPYRIAQLYDLHPCADHIAKKTLCTGKRGHKDLIRDIQDIIDTAERWKQMIQEDQNAI